MANKLRDVTGMKFGEWTVLRRADHNDKFSARGCQRSQSRRAKILGI